MKNKPVKIKGAMDLAFPVPKKKEMVERYKQLKERAKKTKKGVTK